MKQQKHRTKILSFVLSVLMLLGVPLPAFAEAAVENAIEEAQNQPVLMVDKLTETETYWQNADGSITYESHLEPIRYQDEEGNWHDIVNDVVQVDKSAESTDAFKNDVYDYRSESSKNWVLFKSSMFEDNPIKVQNGDRVVYIRPVRTLPLPTAKPEEPLPPSPTQETTPSIQPTKTPQPNPGTNHPGRIDRAYRYTATGNNRGYYGVAGQLAPCTASCCILPGRATGGKPAFVSFERGRTRATESKTPCAGRAGP